MQMNMQTNSSFLFPNEDHPSPAWSIGLGVLFVLSGVVAIGVPVVTSIGLVYVMGALFIICGIAQLILRNSICSPRPEYLAFSHGNFACCFWDRDFA